MLRPALFDPRVIRVVASSIPLDVLVCDDPDLAADASPLFDEVHLLDAAGTEVADRYDELIDGHGLVLRPGPPAVELSSIAAEMRGRRVLYLVGPEFVVGNLGSLREGNVLLSAAAPRSQTADALVPPEGSVLIDLGSAFAVGPELIASVLEPYFPATVIGPGSLLSGDVLNGQLESMNEEVLRRELRRSSDLVKHLRDRNEVLEDRLGRLHFELEEGKRRRFNGRVGRLFRRLRARLRPVAGNRLGLLWHHHPRKVRVPRRYRETRAPEAAPSVSVVIPSYNQAEFIGATIDSLLNQRYPELEVIVQDGASTDDTASVLAGYTDCVSRIESVPDEGQADALNKGFAHAGGEIMGWLNSDDMLMPGALAYVSRYFADHPEVDVVYGHRVLVDSKGREIGRWAMPPHDPEILSWADYIPQETMFWRRDIWERSGGRLDDSFRFALDWDLLLRFRDAGANVVRLPRYLGMFRIHEEQKSSAQVSTVGRGEMDRLRRRVHGRRVAPTEIQAALKPYMRRHRRLDRLQRLRIARH